LIYHGIRKLVLALLLIVAPCLFESRLARAQWAIFKDSSGHLARDIPDEASKAIGDLARQGAVLKSIAFAPGGGWVVLHGHHGLVAKGIADEAVKVLEDLARKGSELKEIAFTPSGGWVILHDRNGLFARNIPDEAFKMLGNLAKQGETLKSVSFAPGDGWVILFGRDGLLARNIADEPFKVLVDINKQSQDLKSISFDSKGGWVILFGRNGLFARNIPDEAFQALVDSAKQGAELKSVGFVGGSLIRLSVDDPSTRKLVLEAMARHKVPGLGIALVNNGRLEWARGYGLIRAGGAEPVTAQTRFQAASISKPVTALAAIRLVQEGKLKLDQPLNEKLVGWKVPENEFTRRKAPTLRQVLDHSAGFTVHGFGGYEAGGKLPTIVQVLNGEPPANSPAIRVEFLPGSKSQYSGGGYTVLQKMMVDVVKKPFPQAMHELVLDPLAMKDSTFQQPPPKGLEAAEAHIDGTALAGRWHVYPELAAAGLWTTPSDLARFVMAIQKANHGDKDAILSPELAREMLRPQIGDAGLGVFLGGKGHSATFGHNGSNAGFECCFIGFVETGQGAVLMTNAQGGQALIDELMQSLRAEYAWPY
jgi:CubicO group peptidase (beta-lactamase class C family)